MNPTYLSAAPIRPHRTSIRPESTISLTQSTNFREPQAAPTGLTTQARETIRNHAPIRRASVAQRSLGTELTVNGSNTFGRVNSPRRQVADATHNLRNLTLSGRGFESENTTTHLDFRRMGQYESDRTRRLPAVDNARRPVSSFVAERLAVQAAKERDGLATSKNSRRRTIYVPHDTTNVVTIHPGSSLISSGSQNGQSVQQSSLNKPIRRGGLAGQKPLRRKSVVAGHMQDATISIHQLPALHELMPVEEDETKQLPILELKASDFKRPKRMSVAFALEKQIQEAILPVLSEEPSSPAPKIRPVQTKTSTRRALDSMSANRRVTQAPRIISHKGMIEADKRGAITRRPVRKSLAPGQKQLSEENIIFVVGKPVQPPVQGIKPNASIHLSSNQASKRTTSLMSSKTVQAPSQFAIFQEDLAHPELYEENWLEHQEIALTQLLNTFFEHTEAQHRQTQTFDALRSSMVHLYNNAEISHLSKRLQASLMYGSLTVPKDLLEKSLRLKDDVGQRRKFLNIFLDTYDLVTLQAAAEAVAGREFVQRHRTSTESNTNQLVTDHGDRRSVENYLDLFFIQHKDVSTAKTGSGTIASFARDQVDQVGSPVWSWRRTVIRSLMLVLILDQAKGKAVLPGCLFQSTSSCKSSENVVKALGTILLPSYGDLLRPLRHLKYEVFATQEPLQEYHYHVENLATDLRDGIVLTRVVEVLLAQNHAALTSSTDSSSLWTLSQHLKYPCLGRPHKLHNVMVALSALVRVQSMPEQLLKDISAFDIVDGHREKTLSLLWALLGQYAVSSLVDWSLVISETINAQQDLANQGRRDDTFETISDISPTTSSKCFNMLFQWSKAICALHSISITNTTTSFAGSSAFKTLITHYTPYLPTISTTSPGLNTTLSETLRSAGCSSAFSSLLSSPQSIIPTRDFTLTSLAFLATRLLPPTKSHRAATTLQRAYRSLLRRREVTRRVHLMRLAANCAAVVQARDRVIGAAVVLQRAWRGVLDAKIARLEGDVRLFQGVARGWMARTKASRRDVRGRAGW